MPTYHFHSGDVGDDPENMGVELSDLKAAKREAAQMLSEMLRNVWDRWEESRVIVTNDEGLILFTMEIVDTRPVRH
jgi:enamine deaminase RidA (YjgF/YER057c/UK114 family)